MAPSWSNFSLSAGEASLCRVFTATSIMPCSLDHTAFSTLANCPEPRWPTVLSTYISSVKISVYTMRKLTIIRGYPIIWDTECSECSIITHDSISKFQFSECQVLWLTEYLWLRAMGPAAHWSAQRFVPLVRLGSGRELALFCSL